MNIIRKFLHANGLNRGVKGLAYPINASPQDCPLMSSRQENNQSDLPFGCETGEAPLKTGRRRTPPHHLLSPSLTFPLLHPTLDFALVP